MTTLSPVEEPVAGAGSELRPEDVVWITSGYEPERVMSLSEESIAVLDLRTFTPESLQNFLIPLRDDHRRCTLVALADWVSIELASAILADFDVALLIRPDDLNNEDAPSYVSRQLREVYAAFKRSGVEFQASNAEEASAEGAMAESGKFDLIRRIFGVDLAGVKPKTCEIAPEYLQPPFAFNAEQQAALLRLANRPATELRNEDEQE